MGGGLDLSIGGKVGRSGGSTRTHIDIGAQPPPSLDLAPPLGGPYLDMGPGSLYLEFSALYLAALYLDGDADHHRAVPTNATSGSAVGWPPDLYIGQGDRVFRATI